MLTKSRSRLLPSQGLDKVHKSLSPTRDVELRDDEEEGPRRCDKYTLERGSRQDSVPAQNQPRCEMGKDRGGNGEVAQGPQGPHRVGKQTLGSHGSLCLVSLLSSLVFIAGRGSPMLGFALAHYFVLVVERWCFDECHL